MRLHGLLLVAFFTLLMVSCQKAYSPDGLVLPGTGGSGGTNTSLLTKSESRTTGSTEASSESFEYDALRRLTRISLVDTDSSNVSSTTVYRYVRNSAGSVTKIISNVLMGGASGSDSLQINIHYPTGSANFDYRIFTFQSGGFAFKDSVTYTYTNGLVTESYQYQDIGQGMALVARIQYTYANGNLSNQKVYSQGTGGMSLGATYTFEYDNKPIAANFGNESFFPGLDPLYAGVNNPAKATIVIAGAGTFMLNYTYQYNSSNIPTGGSVIQTPPSKTRVLTFTYQ